MKIKFESYLILMSAPKGQLRQVMISVFMILFMVACYIAILFVFGD